MANVSSKRNASKIKEFTNIITNIVKKSGGTKTVKLGVSKNLNDNEKIINVILESYKGHSIILAIKGMVSTSKLENCKFQKC